MHAKKMDPCRKILICYSIITIFFSVIFYITISLYLRNTLQLHAFKHDLESFMDGFGERNTEQKFGQELPSPSTRPRMHSNTNGDIESYVEKQFDIMKNDISRTQSNVQSLEERLNSCKESFGVSAAARPDFASEALGGRVEFVQDTPHCQTPFLFRIFGFARVTNAPQNILNSDMSPGNCYAFKGNQSIVVLKLMDKIFVDSVAIEHITEAVSPVGDIKAAPKDFSVYGLKSSTEAHHSYQDENEVPLGSFSYNAKSSPPRQIFTVTTSLPESFEFVKFNFTDNHGHPNYTCIYRVSVFGKLDKK